MLYEITIAGKSVKVDLSRSTSEVHSEQYDADVEGTKRVISIVERRKDSLVISVDERIYRVMQFKRSESSVTFLVGSELVTSEIKGRGAFSQKSSSASEVSSVSNKVTSNFPAKVVKVNVKKGDHVEKNETLLVLEAMKMEAQIKTPGACTVAEVFIVEGEMIERGKLMITLEFDNED